MSSLPTDMFISQQTPAAESLGELLEDARERFARIDTLLEAARRSPLDQREYVGETLEELETIEGRHGELGELLLRALLEGHGHEVAALCIEWTALETLRLNDTPAYRPADYRTDVETVDARDAVAEEPAIVQSEKPARSADQAVVPPSETSNGADHTPRIAKETVTADEAPSTSSFRTVDTAEDVPRERRKDVLSRMGKQPKQRHSHVEVIPAAEPSPADLEGFDMSTLFANGEGFETADTPTYGQHEKNLDRIKKLLRDTPQPPKSFMMVADATPFIEALAPYLDDKTLECTAALPSAWHHGVTDYVTAYARHLQAGICDGGFSDVAEFEEKFKRIFQTLTRFSKTTQPGTIVGLQRSSKPLGGRTWYEAMNARRAHLDELSNGAESSPSHVREQKQSKRAAQTDVLRRLHEEIAEENPTDNALLELVREALQKDVSPNHPRLLSALRGRQELLAEDTALKDVSRALKNQEQEDEQDEASDEKQTVDIPQHIYTQTRGKTLALLGGNRREHAEAKIRDAFGFKEVVWEETKSGHHQRQRRFASKFNNGSYDFVVAIQNLVGHAWTNFIFDDSPESTTVALSEGYGVAAIGRALERYSNWD